MLDGACGGRSPGIVVVEAEHDGLDAPAAESLEQARAG